VHRDGVYHSFTGEKITESQVTEAIRRGLADSGLETGLYMCGPQWADPPHYIIVTETAEPSQRLDQTLSAAVDSALHAINIEYASKRDSGRLGALKVVTVPHDTITAYIESRRQEGNTTQYKYKPFQHDADLVAVISGHAKGIRT
jgi:hypothetical protein